jgi:3-hydroxybutyryl-CoA dehydratase
MSGSLRSVTSVITQQRLQAYADASGDHNPIHVDPAFAAGTPFGGTIAHGMLVLAAIAEMMHAAHGERWRSAGSMKVRFKAPARPGDTITASGAEAGRRDGAVTYGVQCTNQRGDVLIEGRATVRLP